MGANGEQSREGPLETQLSEWSFHGVRRRREVHGRSVRLRATGEMHGLDRRSYMQEWVTRALRDVAALEQTVCRPTKRLRSPKWH
jgi:hypothetical protein